MRTNDSGGCCFAEPYSIAATLVKRDKFDLRQADHFAISLIAVCAHFTGARGQKRLIINLIQAGVQYDQVVHSFGR